MLPQIHLNLDSVAFDRLYQILLVPFIPGSVLVGGLVLIRPELMASIPLVSELSPYVRLLLIVIAAYVVGWVLYAATVIVTGITTAILGLIFFKKQFVRDNQNLSHGTAWQKAATQFLGPELTPAPLPTPALPAQVSLQQIGERFKQTFESTLKSNNEWKEWYDVLQEYLLKDVPPISENAVVLVITAEATGWALVCLSIASVHARHWQFYGLEILFILMGLLAPIGWAVNYLNSDRLHYWKYTALLLSEVRKTKTKPDSTPSR